MGYNLINWENSPSKQTPINAENLNQMDENIAKAIQGTRFNFSATFTADNVLKNTTSTEALGTGSFATSQTDIVTVFVADNVTKINSGTFSGCTSLKTIYIDNTVGNVEIVSGAVPDGVSVVYSNDDNFINVNELLASAIKSLKKQVNADKSDWENRATSIEAQHKTDVQALTDKTNSIVDQANTDRQNFNNSVDEINTTLDTKENVSNKVSEITHPSLDYYPDTKAVFDYVNSKLETPLADIETLKNNKVNITDFNIFKDSTNSNISTNSTNIENLKNELAEKNKKINDLSIKVTTDKAGSTTISDSSNNNIVGLTLYGKSTQSAEPSPDSPAEIVSAKRLRVYKKNLFDFSNCPSACGPWWKELDSDPVVDRENNIITFTTLKKTEAGVYLWHSNYNKYTGIFWGIDYTKLANKRVTLSFDVQSDIDCIMKVMLTKKTYNCVHILATKQRVTVTEVVDTSDLRKAYCFYLSNTAATVTISNIQVEVNNVATDYEKCEYQECATAYELRGVNDVTDTLTVNSDGTGYLTQNLIYERLTSGKSQSGQLWQYSATTKRFYRDDTRIKTNGGVPNLLCSHLKVADNLKDTSLDNSIGFTSDTATAPGLAVRKLDLNGDITAFKNLLDANEVYVLAPLVTPIVTKLSKEEVEKILSLHTYYPNTTIISDSDCQVEYVADPKNYIDNKILEVATALVAHESEVM